MDPVLQLLFLQEELVAQAVVALDQELQTQAQEIVLQNLAHLIQFKDLMVVVVMPQILQALQV
tara:strand:+ start:141 stop:329 length:189 start_codon:yes stop_codon:yes gene_type:complete